VSASRRPAWPTWSSHVIAPLLHVVGVAVALVLIGGRAAAETDDEARPVVVISGPRGGDFESTADTTGFSDVIDTRGAWRGYRSVGDVLDRSVGVRVRQLGGREDFSTVSVRGSTPAQVKVLLDGVTLNRAADAVVNLADLPLDSVERIEVYRGFTPVRFASSSAASVVNIITRRPTEPEVGGSVSYGSFDSAKASLFGATPLGGGALSGFFTYRRTDGDFEFKSDNGTPLNPGDDEVRDRRNNDYESFDLLAKYTTRLSDGARLTVTNDAFYKDEGTPGVATQEALRARFRKTRNIFAADLSTPDDRLGLGLDFTYVDQVQRDPANPPDDVRLGLPYVKGDTDTYALNLNTRFADSLGEYNFVELSAESTYEVFDGRFRGTSETRGQNEERNTIAIAAGDDVIMPGLGLTVSPQLRFEALWNRFDGECLSFTVAPECDEPSSDEQSVDPRVGARWDPHPNLTFKGNIGTYFRPPTFEELFGGSGFTLPNATLEPETGVNRDVGFLVHGLQARGLRRLDLEYAYFRNNSDDLILLIGTGNRIPTPRNIDKARVSGHELRLAAELPAGVSLEANYTRQDSENRSRIGDLRGNDLPSTPQDEVFGRLGVDRQRWSIAYEVEYRSSVFLDPANDPLKRVPNHTTHDASLSLFPFAGDFAIKLEVDNFTDERFNDVYNFPRPGRAFYVTVSYRARPGSSGRWGGSADGS